MTIDTALIATISSAVTGIITFVIPKLIEWSKQKSEVSKQNKELELQEQKQASDIKLSENEQAIKVYREVVENLNKNITSLIEQLKTLETEHLKCQEENGKLVAQTAKLETSMGFLTSRIQYLEKTLQEHKIAIAQSMVEQQQKE